LYDAGKPGHASTVEHSNASLSRYAAKLETQEEWQSVFDNNDSDIDST